MGLRDRRSRAGGLGREKGQQVPVVVEWGLDADAESTGGTTASSASGMVVIQDIEQGSQYAGFTFVD